MQATRIIAVRHGETAWNVDARLQGHLDIELNEVGHWQAQRVGQALARESVHTIYSSDLRRAWDTARQIQHHTGAALHAHAGLRERRFGIFEGRTFAEIEQSHPEQALSWRKREPDFSPEGGGESLVAVRQRVVETIHELAACHGGETIVVVAHGGVLDVLYRAATGQEIQAPRTWTLGNASINRLLWSEHTLTLIGWADTGHLEDTQRDEISESSPRPERFPA